MVLLSLNTSDSERIIVIDPRDLQQIGEAMALLEADADAIMQFVSRRHRALANNDDSNSPDLPDTPPVHAAVGQAQSQSSSEGQGQNSVQGQGQSSSQGQNEGAADYQQETPMETDKPGNIIESVKHLQLINKIYKISVSYLAVFMNLVA